MMNVRFDPIGSVETLGRMAMELSGDARAEVSYAKTRSVRARASATLERARDDGAGSAENGLWMGGG